MKYYLTPMFDSRKSFYNKAIVVTADNSINLYSYNTLVAKIHNDGTIVLTANSAHYTNTTLRHIKEFLKQNNFKADSKKQLLTDYKTAVLIG